MRPIIIATSREDSAQYARQRGRARWTLVTPRSPDACRGRSGPVYATPAARQHQDFNKLLAVAMPCALGRDIDRVA